MHMTDRQKTAASVRAGTRLVIVGVALSLTGLISEAALVVQLVAYEPPCEPLAAWSFVGACGGLRILVLLMLPFLVAGLVLVVLGIAHRWRSRSTLPSG